MKQTPEAKMTLKDFTDSYFAVELMARELNSMAKDLGNSAMAIRNAVVEMAAAGQKTAADFVWEVFEKISGQAYNMAVQSGLVVHKWLDKSQKKFTSMDEKDILNLDPEIGVAIKVYERKYKELAPELAGKSYWLAMQIANSRMRFGNALEVYYLTQAIPNKSAIPLQLLKKIEESKDIAMSQIDHGRNIKEKSRQNAMKRAEDEGLDKSAIPQPGPEDDGDETMSVIAANAEIIWHMDQFRNMFNLATNFYKGGQESEAVQIIRDTLRVNVAKVEDILADERGFIDRDAISDRLLTSFFFSAAMAEMNCDQYHEAVKFLLLSFRACDGANKEMLIKITDNLYESILMELLNQQKTVEKAAEFREAGGIMQ